jgi:beta-mannosidase
MNMLRLSGTMLYESQEFYDLCDELGILVWQDFMFANMDYPASDERFAASVRTEAAQLLDRLQLSPSLVVCCGGSEVEQQAAMMGLPDREWSSTLFQELLPGIVHEARPDVAYVPSSPSGGVLPFHVDEGVSHYYGVGAYMRSLDDARRARVRFTSECLAFANVPCDETLEALLGDGELPTQHPRWKARVPRDRSTSWDFDDVRDHYVERIFGVDAAALRRVNCARYLELGRVATGEAMATAMTEWRRCGSECTGALVWFLRDLWPGAGWGVVDARGYPKAAYHYLRRVLAPVALLATDEGLNGLRLHAINDRAAPLSATLKLTLYRGEAVVARGESEVFVDPHDRKAISADGVIGHFTDMTHAYRFGPPGHDVAVAVLRDATTDTVLGRAFHFPRGLCDEVIDVGVVATTARNTDGSVSLSLQSRRAAHAVAIDARGMIPDDDYFHLEPGETREVTLKPVTGHKDSFVAVKPLNAATSTRATEAPSR